MTTATPATPTMDRNAAFLRVYPLLRWYARKQARDGIDREELEQNASLRFLRYWHTSFSGDPAHLTRYVRYVVAGAAGRMRDRRDKDIQTVYAAAERPPVQQPEPPRPPDEVAAVAAAVRAAVETLPPAQRELVVRRYGLDGREPARLLDLGTGVTREAVRQRVQAALHKLAPALIPVA